MSEHTFEMLNRILDAASWFVGGCCVGYILALIRINQLERRGK